MGSGAVHELHAGESDVLLVSSEGGLPLVDAQDAVDAPERTFAGALVRSSQRVAPGGRFS